MTGPACGNNPSYRMTDGDRRVVDSFRAYLAARAALARVERLALTFEASGNEFIAKQIRAVVADETAATETQAAEDPARIDGLRPEFTEHASIEAIEVQLDRARRQERRWHIRAEWLIGLRQARTEQPAAGARQDGAQQ